MPSRPTALRWSAVQPHPHIVHDRRCVEKVRPFLMAVGLAGMLFPLPALSQDSAQVRDYHYVETLDPWLCHQNSASLTRFRSVSLSEAEAIFSRQHGGFTDYSGSRDVVEAQARITSLYRINRRTVVSGQMEYSNYTGRDMGGSVFIRSSRKPFDIEEDSLTNLGRKHLDTYRLTGGVGIDLYRGLSVGALMDYTAANYAKYKDLRHKNKLMDMTLTAGVYVPVGSVLRMGANYYYRRTTESVTFSTYSHEEKVYKSLINFGAHMGRVEQFSMYGFTNSSREMPFVDDYNGGGVQIGLDLGSLTFANELTAAHRKGYYGRKSPYTVTFTHHTSNVYSYRGGIVYNSGRTSHHLDATLSAENLRNDLSTYREMTNEAGATYYEYYDDVKSANKLWVEGSASYTFHWGIRGELPTWSVRGGVNWLHYKQTAYSYPYYRRQKTNRQEYFLEGAHNINLRRGVLRLEATLSWAEGAGAPFEDLTFVEPSDKQTPPPTMDAWLYREHQWLTAAQYAVGGSVKYTFAVPGTRLHAFVKAAASHRKSNESTPYSIGSDRISVSLSAGCQF